MDAVASFVDLLLHVDRHLQVFAGQHGVWVYALLFAIVFVETGVVVMPFLPGDSLLFVTGALAGAGIFELPVALSVLLAAAVAGNQTNYTIGRTVGPRVFGWGHTRWFDRRAFDRTHAFYERWGGLTLVAGRFLPFVRTFAPFVAGVACMTRRRFTAFDVAGGALWVGSLVALGYLFGNVPAVKANLNLIVWAMIGIPGAVVLFGLWRRRRQARAAPAGTV